MGKAQTIGFHISIRPSAVALIFLRVLKKNPVFFFTIPARFTDT